MKLRFQKGIAPILVGKTSIFILSTFVIGQIGLLGVQIQLQKENTLSQESVSELKGSGQSLQPVIIPPGREDNIALETTNLSPSDNIEISETEAGDASVEEVIEEDREVNREDSSQASSEDQESKKIQEPIEEIDSSPSELPVQQKSPDSSTTDDLQTTQPIQESPQQKEQPAQVPVPSPSSSLFPQIAQKPLHVESWSFAGDTANAIRSSNPAGAALLDKIAATAQARWFGEWVSNISAGVGAYVQEAKGANAVPMIVLYNIPYRDCHGYSGGGLADKDAYLQWIRQAQQGIGNNPAVVILEPDAIALVDCLPQAKRTERYQMLAEAVNILNQGNQTLVYLDAGHSHWVTASVMASRLQQSGVGAARGFALNVSNFRTSQENISYGETLSGMLGGKGYVIDTSRNGQGPEPNAEWCNPPGRGLGERPRFVQDASSLDAYLWIKKPGESDGTCNGGPSAGSWWPEYAIGLAERAKE